MSTNEFFQLPQFLSVDPRLLVSQRKQILISRGASNATLQTQTSSSVSNSSVSWTVVLNSDQSTIIDPYMWAEIPIQVTVLGTGLTGPQTVENLLVDNFALRQYPLTSVTNISQVMINNQSCSCQPWQFIHALSLNQDFVSNEAFTQSITPIMPDMAPAYSLLNGSGKNPLLNYYDGPDIYDESRGSFNSDWETITSTTGSYVFNAVIREPIINPILDYTLSANDRQGLAYVRLLDIRLNFTAYLSRMFSLSDLVASNITSITVNIGGSSGTQPCNLHMLWLSVPVSQRLPQLTLRSYNTLVTNITAAGSFTPGQQKSVTTQNIQFNQIPRQVWVFVGDAQTDISNGYLKPDYFFPIQSLSATTNNKPGVYGNQGPADLYNNLMVRAGSRVSYIQSQYYVGSVLQMRPELDWGLADDEAPGLLGTYQFNCTLTCTNISPDTITANIYVVYSTDTILTTDSSGTSNLINGFVNRQDVVNSNSLPAHPALMGDNDIYGGNFFDDIKNFFKKIPIISTIAGLIPHPIAQAVSSTAKMHGYNDYEGYPQGGKYTPQKEMKQVRRRYNRALRS